MIRVLVLGGTGLLGRPAVTRLHDDGYEVRALARDPDAATAMFDDAVDVVAGDVTDRDELRRAMTGCDGVHISISGPAERTAAEHVAALAPQTGVDRITYLSGSTVADRNGWFPMVAEKLEAERALQACPVPSTILCPSWPMEQLPRFVIDGRASVIGDQPTPLHWFAAADLARMVSNAYGTPAAADTRLYVHGPEALTMVEALRRYCRAEHPQIEVSVMPIGAARSAAEATGDQALAFMTELMAYFDQAGELGDSSEADQLLGPNTVTLDMWLERRRAAS